MVPKNSSKEDVKSKLDFLLKKDFKFAVHEYDMVQGIEAIGICIDNLKLMMEQKHEK